MTDPATLQSFEFNIDSSCIELKCTDGALVSINCSGIENEAADNRHQQSKPDWLIYIDPAAYADLILNGEPNAT